MGLPTYDSLYLLVARSPMQAVQLAMEHMHNLCPEKEPTLQTTKFYNRLLKETLDVAIGVKVFFGSPWFWFFLFLSLSTS
jgi:hypothetical protein